MKILYLYSEVMGYTLSTISSLVSFGAEVHVVYWDKKKLTPYEIPKLNKINFYPRSKLTLKSMTLLANNIKPDITVVSGWMDYDYLKISRILRNNGAAVVCCLDQQWEASNKKILRSILGFSGFFLRYFSHAWVSGVYQYDYAKKLGFTKKNIFFDLYSADIKKFKNIYKKRKKKYPHRFLFLGRPVYEKGLDILLEAWDSLKSDREDWDLCLIGGHKIKRKYAGIIAKDFIQPDNLIKEFTEVGCFVLPSRLEPWGVAVHEAAIAGLPMVLSDNVGSSSTFLINGWNGYSFKFNDTKQLARCMFKIIKAPLLRLQEMGKRSNEMSKRITPETSASNLISILKFKL